MSPRSRWVVGSLAWFALCLPPAASADLIKLKNGGEIRGDLERKQKVPAAGEPLVIRTLTGGVVSVDPADVQFCTRRSLKIEEYETLRRHTPPTLEGHRELAEWCRKHGLKTERETHLHAIIELDPENVEAHRGLGHVQHEGQWTTRDALMSAQGYVKHKGRYVLPQELELIQGNAETSAAEKSWFKKIHVWHGWLLGSNPNRQNDALEELQRISDPHAVPALAKSFRNEPNENARTLFIKILARIKAGKAIEAIVIQSVHDVSAHVRTLALESIPQEFYQDAIPYFARELRNPLNVVVARAAEALEELGDEQAVPHLIDALVTIHTYTVQVRERVGQTGSFSTDGQSMGTGTEMILPPNIEIMLRTGNLPYGVQVLDSAPPNVMYRTRNVTFKQMHQNPTVLSALKKFTGQDFGYDKRTWRLWWTSQKPTMGKKSTAS